MLQEVNASPALAADSEVDWLVKEPLLRDLVTLLDFGNADSHDVLDRQAGSRSRGRGGYRRGGAAAVRPHSNRRARNRSHVASRRNNGGGSGGGGGGETESVEVDGTATRQRRAKPQSAPGEIQGAQRRQPKLRATEKSRDSDPAVNPPRIGGYEQLFPFNATVQALAQHLAAVSAGKRGGKGTLGTGVHYAHMQPCARGQLWAHEAPFGVSCAVKLARCSQHVQGCRGTWSNRS